MPNPTSNQGYNRPDKGTTDWHTPINENFGALEVDVEVRDTESNIKNNYTPHSNAKALATDTGVVFLGDGSNWQQIGVISNEKRREFIVGDGDDLMDKINANGKGWYILRPRSAEYIIDEQNATANYAVPTGVHIRGDGEVQPEGGQNVSTGTPGLYSPEGGPVIAPVDPSNNPLSLEAFSSVGECWVRTTWSKGAIPGPGAPRYTGVHWNKRSDGEDRQPAFWAGRHLEMGTGGDSNDDNPSLTIHNHGGQGDALWITGSGPSIQRIRVPDPANVTKLLDFEAGTDNGFAHIGYFNAKGHLYLGSNEPRILMNAPSTYAGNFPAAEERETLGMTADDGLIINAGFAGASGLGSEAGLIEARVSDHPFKITDPANGKSLAQLDSQDLTASDAPSPGDPGVVAMHDGTNAPEDLYRSDPGNSQWVRVGDETTTISY